jgi:hypothetical protein
MPKMLSIDLSTPLALCMHRMKLYWKTAYYYLHIFVTLKMDNVSAPCINGASNGFSFRSFAAGHAGNLLFRMCEEFLR